MGSGTETMYSLPARPLLLRPSLDPPRAVKGPCPIPYQKSPDGVDIRAIPYRNLSVSGRPRSRHAQRTRWSKRDLMISCRAYINILPDRQPKLPQDARRTGRQHDLPTYTPRPWTISSPETSEKSVSLAMPSACPRRRIRRSLTVPDGSAIPNCSDLPPGSSATLATARITDKQNAERRLTLQCYKNHSSPVKLAHAAKVSREGSKTGM